MASFFANFDNHTEQTWTMAVWQTLPPSPGLQSVSWKQTTVPRSGSSGVKWDITYDVGLGDFEQEGGIGVYRSSQLIQGIELGTAWDVVFENNVQQLKAAGATNPGQIRVHNKSNRFANPGIGMSGAASVYKHQVPGNGIAQFEVTPSYFLGLFNNVELGTVISSNVIVGPEPIIFPTGMNAVNAVATMDGSNIVLKISYGSQSEVDLEAAMMQIEALNAGASKAA